MNVSASQADIYTNLFILMPQPSEKVKYPMLNKIEEPR